MIKVTVNRFAGIESRTICVDKIYIMEENNGYGKSSMLKAINFCLSGVYPENPIYNNGNICQVDIVTGNTTLSRVLKRTDTGYQNIPYINGKKCTQKAFEEWLSQNMMPGSACKVLCNPLALSEISETALGEFIMNVVNKKISSERLRTLAGQMTDEQYEYLIDAIDACKLDRTQIDISDISSLYNGVYSTRQVNNKKIKSYGAVVLPEPPANSLEELQKKLTQIAEKEAQANIQKNNQRIYNINVAKVKHIQSQMEEINAKLKNLPSEEEIPDVKVYAEKQKKITEEIICVEKNISVFETTKQSDYRLINELDKNTCPLSSKIVCSANREELKLTLRNECMEMDKKIAAEKEKKEVLLNEQKSINELMEKARIIENNARSRKSLQDMLKALKESMPDISNVPVTTENIDYSAEKTKIQESIRELNLYNETKKRYREVEILKHKTEIYTALIEMLGPKGVIKNNFWKLITGHLESEMNTTVSRIKNVRIKLDTGNGLNILYSTNDRDYIKFNSLSGGEKIIATLAIYHVINRLYDNKILLIDDLDRVDDLTYASVMEFIESIKDDYDAIICAKVKH